MNTKTVDYRFLLTGQLRPVDMAVGLAAGGRASGAISTSPQRSLSPTSR